MFIITIINIQIDAGDTILPLLYVNGEAVKVKLYNNMTPSEGPTVTDPSHSCPSRVVAGWSSVALADDMPALTTTKPFVYWRVYKSFPNITASPVGVPIFAPYALYH